MSDESCIVERLDSIAELSEADRKLLSELERDAQVYPAGAILRSVDQFNAPLYTLRSGWACSIRLLPDGRRQILEIFRGSQIMGLNEVGLEQAQTELVALTEIEACPFPQKALLQVLAQSASLASLLFMTIARDNAVLQERIMNIGKKNGVERLAHFLLELKSRIGCDTNEIDVPFNQTVIGDALGMTSVHVSRSLAQLRKLGLLDTSGKVFRILDPAALADFGSFCPKYLSIRSDQAVSTAQWNVFRPGPTTQKVPA